MSIEKLRAKVLEHTAGLRHTYTVYLDENTRNQILGATQILLKLISERDNPKLGRPSISGPKAARAVTDADVDATRVKLDALRAAVTGDAQVHLVFRRLLPDDYQQKVYAHTTEGIVDLMKFYPELAEASYLATKSTLGDDLNLTWDQVKQGALSSRDLDTIYEQLAGFNQTLQTVPLVPASFGEHATS